MNQYPYLTTSQLHSYTYSYDHSYIGITNNQNAKLRFDIKEKDRGDHIYCIEKASAGKGTPY